jgi:hypothetical protein
MTSDKSIPPLGQPSDTSRRCMRQQIEALPRYILMLQPPDGWTKERGRSSEPVAHEAVKLSEVLALLDASSREER